MEQPVLPLTDGSDMIALLREQLQALEAAQGGSQDPRSRAALERLEAALQQLQQAQQHWQEAAPAVAPDTLAPTNQAQLAQDVSRCVNPLAGRLIEASRAADSSQQGQEGQTLPGTRPAGWRAASTRSRPECRASTR
jgi:hypothetical protein